MELKESILPTTKKTLNAIELFTTIEKYISDKNNSLSQDQKDILNMMNLVEKLMICIPTGAGKGYIMRNRILNLLHNKIRKTLLVVTHRLILNGQHLNDIFKDTIPLAANTGYVWIGSDEPNLTKESLTLLESYNRKFRREFVVEELIKKARNSSDVERLSNEFKSKGMNVVVISTYHSLEYALKIKYDETYLDEVHSATADLGKEIPNIQTKKMFSFTATPKDLVEALYDSDLCITTSDTEDDELIVEASIITHNNNVKLYGERVGITFKDAVDKGTIVPPIIQLIKTTNNLLDINTEEQARLIVESFLYHLNLLKDRKNPLGIEVQPKLLVRCSNIAIMREIVEFLKNNDELKKLGINICRGDSGNSTLNLNEEYMINNTTYSKSNYIENLSLLSEKNEPMIVLHIKQLTEGLNINGFTSLELLPKRKFSFSLRDLIQNMGRTTRLHELDRERLATGEITITDKSLWIKPNSVIMIPYWDGCSEANMKQIFLEICKLMRKTGYDFEIQNHILDDLNEGKQTVENPFNEIKRKDKNKDKIEDIVNIMIENLDQVYDQYVLDQETIKKQQLNIVNGAKISSDMDKMDIDELIEYFKNM